MPKTPDVDDGATLPDAEAEHTSVGPVVGPGDDGIEELSPDNLAVARGGAPATGGRQVSPGEKVTLGAPPPPDAGPEKTRVASLDDIGAPPAPDDHQATMIMENPLAAKRSAGQGRLVVVAGKAEGETFDLAEGTVVVGRSRDANLCLLDIGASRRHAELVVDAGGVRVRDLGSGNGTLVNGEPVTEVDLADGDGIAIGEHVLRYEAAGAPGGALARVGASVSPGTAVVAAPAVPSVAAVRRARRSAASGGDPRRKRLLLAAAGVGALLVVLLGVKRAMGPATPAASARPTSSPAAIAKTDFEAGLALFKKGAYADALAKFQLASQADPNLGKAKEYVKATKREMAAAAAIQKGNALLTAGKYDEARAAFQTVGSQSLRYTDAEAGIERVSQAQGGEAAGQGQQGIEATRRKLDDLVAKVKGIADGPGSTADKDQAFRDTIAAVGALGSTLDAPARSFAHALAVSPDDAKAKAGQAALAHLKQELGDKQAWATRQYDAWKAHNATRSKENHAKYVRRMLAPGIQQFDQGQFRQAATTFTKLAATATDRDVKRLAGQKAAAIKGFLPAYSRGMAAPSNRPIPGALKALSVAYTQAGVVDSHSPVLAKVRQQLGNRYYLKGRVAYNAKRYAEAYQAWGRALHFDPEQRLASKGLGDLKALAKKLYLQAYVQKALNRKRAIAEWKQVLQMTPATDSYHQKAEERLQELGVQ